MKVTASPLDLTTLSISSEQDAIRTPGTHVSQILRHIKATIGPVKNDFDENDLAWFALIGRLWERTLSETLYLPPRYERIGEIQAPDGSGIIGSPDCVDTQEWAVTDFKVTWTGAKGFQEKPKFREYVWQVKSYCWLLGMVRAHLDVLHVRDLPPVATHYDLLFTPQEIVEHARMLKANVPTGSSV
jgi:hypothetical protein